MTRNDGQEEDDDDDDALVVTPDKTNGDASNENEEELTIEGEEATSKKRIVRHYHGINPEVEAELQRVIDELQEKSGEAAAPQS